MKVLELNLSEPTVTKLQEAAERLSLSPEELAILSLEEKLAQLDDQYRKRCRLRAQQKHRTL